MIEARFKPIDEWPLTPTPPHKRRSSPFRAGWTNTLDLLESELYHLKAKDIIVDGYFTFADIRNDGWPKSKARPSQPGIVLSFDTQRGRISMPCDTYNDWEANLRAIALTLENLRAIERYGVTTERGEQYTGWLKLSPVNPADEATEHAKTIAKFAYDSDSYFQILTSQADFEVAWKEATKKTHPDRIGGSGESLRQVIAARDRIRQIKCWL